MASAHVQVRAKAVATLVLLLAACGTACAPPARTASQSPFETSTPSPPVTPTGSPTGTDRSMVVMAAGDIACDPADPNFNLGRGTPTRCRQADTASLLTGADLILPLGDNQYECGGLAAYRASFDASWGAFKSRMRPAIGNHEHNVNQGSIQVGTGCNPTRFAASYYAYFGSAAPAGAYSFDAGGWHFATVDSTCGPPSCLAQASWLQNDLAAHPTACSIVFYHHPRWSSGKEGNHPQGDLFWRVAAAAGVEIILNGHDHDYERFAPMDVNGMASATGVREFVIGTGGRGLLAFRSIQPNSEVRNADTFGVLQLTLHAGSYDWKFLPIAGQTFTDSGTGSCH